MTNGAQALIRTLVDSGVTACFTNPGTSEMHFVAALDTVPEMRGVLALFEGVATGAADGYARMTDRPAATLLHLGPGLGNGLANLHNARRAKVPLVNIVGDHATYHAQYDAQLQSDIETVARNVSPWIRTSTSPQGVARDAAEAVAASLGPPGQVATLILPADVSWSDGAVPAPPAPHKAAPTARSETIETIARALRGGGRTAILLGGRALRERGLTAAARVAASTGAKLLAEVFPTRIERGAGLPPVERLAYSPGARDGPTRRSGAPRPRRHEAARVVLCLPGQAELPRARVAARFTCWQRPRTTRSGALRRSSKALAAGGARTARRRIPPLLQQPVVPKSTAGRPHRREGVRGGGGGAPGGRDRLRRGPDVRSDVRRRHGRRAAARSCSR